MRFGWDIAKNEKNIAERGIDFAFAVEAFSAITSTVPDTRKDYGEDRFISYGRINSRLYVIVWTPREDSTLKWIISARKANAREVKKFE